MQMGTFMEVRKFLHKLNMLPRATKRVPLISGDQLTYSSHEKSLPPLLGRRINMTKWAYYVSDQYKVHYTQSLI